MTELLTVFVALILFVLFVAAVAALVVLLLRLVAKRRQRARWFAQLRDQIEHRRQRR